MGTEWNYMTSFDLINIGSDNDMLPDGIKPLPEPIITYYL